MDEVEKKTEKTDSGCGQCGFRKYAERKPESFWAKLWRWHTKWCPGWKAYQAELKRREAGEKS